MKGLIIEKAEFEKLYGEFSFCVLECSNLWIYYCKLGRDNYGRFYSDLEDKLKKQVLSQNLPWCSFDFSSIPYNMDFIGLRDYLNRIFSEEKFGGVVLNFKFFL